MPPLLRPRRVAIALAAVIGATLTGCADGAITACDELAEESLQYLADVVEEYGDLTMDQAMDRGVGGEAVEELSRRGDELAAAGRRLDCDPAEMETYLQANLDRIVTTSGTFGEFIVRVMLDDDPG